MNGEEEEEAEMQREKGKEEGLLAKMAGTFQLMPTLLDRKVELGKNGERTNVNKQLQIVLSRLLDLHNDEDHLLEPVGELEPVSNNQRTISRLAV